MVLRIVVLMTSLMKILLIAVDRRIKNFLILRSVPVGIGSGLVEMGSVLEKVSVVMELCTVVTEVMRI